MQRANDNHPNGAATDGTRRQKCPICGKGAVDSFLPFCSKRCADVDLHRWLGGIYAIKSEEAVDPLEDPE